MKAVQFNVAIPQYVLCKALGRLIPSLYIGPLSCTRYRDVPEPKLPDEEWVKVKVKYGGICGSDLNLIFLHDSPATSPFASFPFTIGHEVVGVIDEVGQKVSGIQRGERVIVDPILSCMARGFHEACPACRRGDLSLCERMASGHISPGLLIGGCRDTGGSWSPYLVAHHSQIFKVPATVSDRNAIMTDPFATALHAIMRDPPRDSDTVLVIGAGVIGICVIAALRALDYSNRIIVLAKHPFQMELARLYGASENFQLTNGSECYEQLAQLLGAKVLPPLFGKPVIQGGADITYECVGRDRSIDDALRFTKSGGKVKLLGVVAAHFFWQCLSRYLAKLRRYRSEVLTLSSQ
ncbi:alcohol dehydrogenase catalytic domain-containing protein [Paenibacillus melissococcoides]|uniref:Alcohol dehydrogenase catalytic domain-containing protein n=1 Tax=Paenibacillus melissococcoides TaxID=2912268 RepID=A0ABN8U038_9BACL|nr:MULTISPECIES: alcohol dehydrogenase catalytic domain-containing protein [Paenibacillus]CAH8244431.1 alcohol dehydrogenase catalytic domain-containing protein [Paenibacillus melissococcoides]CAH8703224.1 alcohol dehydrogenase catalytic domain-containing protein [Paenibacillus melissococcoides]CAH8705543.1 alcohol dehydrogenase catalytic domain-containing protein [Paenibacillus melissococcoides]CAH8721882.1 alcohol dehydrogenase catalytic domain-containing protein [Paenibacillus melissococcoid